LKQYDDFLEERSKIEIPSGDVARIRLLAKELALGVHRGLWERNLGLKYNSNTFGGTFDGLMTRRWGRRLSHHDIVLLNAHGFINLDNGITLTTAAFGLLEETEPNNVFVAYTHSNSSAFALLVVTKLQDSGQNAFCDMSLVPGEEWHPELEKQIKKCEYFIVLVGKDTRNSKPTIREITWALDNEKIVIPMWHNGFEFVDKEWEDVAENVVEAIQRKQAVVVQKESAAGYNAAIVELLTNRFGVTP